MAEKIRRVGTDRKAHCGLNPWAAEVMV